MSGMGLALKALRSPVEGIVWIYSTGLFLYACYLASPLYSGGYGSILTSAGLQRGVEIIMAVIFMIASLPGVISPFLRSKRRVLKYTTFSIFLSFLFLSILRIIIVGWFPVTWFPLLLIALTSGYLHMWVKVRRE